MMWYYSYDYVIWQKGDYLGRWAYSNCRSPLKAEFGLASVRESCWLEDGRATNIQAGRGAVEWSPADSQQRREDTIPATTGKEFCQPTEETWKWTLPQSIQGGIQTDRPLDFSLWDSKWRTTWSSLLMATRLRKSALSPATVWEREEGINSVFVRMQSQLPWQRPKW